MSTLLTCECDGFQENDELKKEVLTLEEMNMEMEVRWWFPLSCACGESER